MDLKKLKKILAGFSIAGLIAGASLPTIGCATPDEKTQTSCSGSSCSGKTQPDDDKGKSSCGKSSCSS
ncbi:MAG: SbtA family thio(seleno)oxazole RiPP natural product precursor [Pseudomonadota bacterium]